ncbi:MAG TPA: hypothetical protein VHS99_28045 [Chloroflexota bacterium]|nr:hypothetical protein [Chloroflexota bacterium]
MPRTGQAEAPAGGAAPAGMPPSLPAVAVLALAGSALFEATRRRLQG